MEISFVIAAMLRFWWLVAICVALGTVPLLLAADGSSSYESTAALLVSPPSESRVQVNFTNDPDRYVIGEMAVLESATIADAVAERLDGAGGAGGAGGSLADAVQVEHRPETDIVTVTATASTPEGAAALANAYVDTYLESLDARIAETQTPELAELDEQLATVGRQLAAVDDAIGDAMAPYLDLVGDPDAGALPSVEQVAPNLVSQKSTLLTQYGEILSLTTQLEVSSKLRVTSRLIQTASQPEEVASSGGRALLLGPLAGLLLGAYAAVVLTRTSRTVHGERQVSQILGASTTTLPRSSAIDADPTTTLEHLPAELVPIVDRLCVGAEAAGQPSAPIRIVVTGTQRVAGATTIATAMAARFAAGGATVLLIDANVQNPELTRQFGPDIAGLSRVDLDGPVGHSPHPLITVVGISNVADIHHLRRQQLPALVEAAARRADIVIFDAGSLQHDVAAVQLTRLADAVVVAVPAKGQRVDELESASRHLGSLSAQLLAVVVPVRPRHRSEVAVDRSEVASDEPIPDLARSGAEAGSA